MARRSRFLAPILALGALLVVASLSVFGGPAGSQNVFCNGLEATILGTTGNDYIEGTEGDDVIVTFEGVDRVRSFGGDDTICTDEGRDLVWAGGGNDYIHGGPGVDRLLGESGDDWIIGGAGRDAVKGGGGEDRLNGGRSTDKCLAGESFNNCEKFEEDIIVPDPEPELGPSDNVLLIILDDVGIDWWPGYDVGASKPSMPHVEALAAEGITFDDVWAYPICSPTRSSILTGQYGFRTGVLDGGPNGWLDPDTQSLQEYVNASLDDDIATAVIGKWHLAGGGRVDLTHPDQFGLDLYTGLISSAPDDYYEWDKVVDAETVESTTYATTEFTDDAVDWINDQDGRWFAWVAYTTPHSPLHAPPDDTHSQGDLDGADDETLFTAMLENADHEIGRLLDGIPADELEKTTIIVIGDNGTSGRLIQDPYVGSQAKTTVYQGGVHVPMIISGHSVTQANTHDASMINTVDLHPTIAAILGVEAPDSVDGVDFSAVLDGSGSSARTFQISENVDSVAIRSGDHKLIAFSDGSRELYDLAEDPYESDDLLDGTPLAEDVAIADALEADLTAEGFARF